MSMAAAASRSRSSRASTPGSTSRGGGGATTRARVYQKNFFQDRLKNWLIWLALNFRYAVQYVISIGGRLEHLPKRSERPLVAGLVFVWGLLTALMLLASFLSGHLSIISLVTYVQLGVAAAYVAGAYFLIMESPAAEEILGIAFVVDFLLVSAGVVATAIKLFLFTLFLLICVGDWRQVVRLPKRPNRSI
jgi:hypothetical protein